MEKITVAYLRLSGEIIPEKRSENLPETIYSVRFRIVFCLHMYAKCERCTLQISWKFGCFKGRRRLKSIFSNFSQIKWEFEKRSAARLFTGYCLATK